MILIITIFLIISLLYVVIIVNDGIFIANLLFLSNVMIDARLNHVMKNHSCLFFIIVFDKFRIFHSAIVTFVVFVVMSYQLIVLDFNWYFFNLKTLFITFDIKSFAILMNAVVPNIYDLNLYWYFGVICRTPWVIPSEH